MICSSALVFLQSEFGTHNWERANRLCSWPRSGHHLSLSSGHRILFHRTGSSLPPAHQRLKLSAHHSLKPVKLQQNLHFEHPWGCASPEGVNEREAKQLASWQNRLRSRHDGSGCPCCDGSVCGSYQDGMTPCKAIFHALLSDERAIAVAADRQFFFEHQGRVPLSR